MLTAKASPDTPEVKTINALMPAIEERISTAHPDLTFHKNTPEDYCWPIYSSDERLTGRIDAFLASREHHLIFAFQFPDDLSLSSINATVDRAVVEFNDFIASGTAPDQ